MSAEPAPSGRRAPAPTRLTALVVNFNSGAFACSCVASLRGEWERAGRAAQDLDVVVVDNASPADQSVWLARLEADGATVVRNATNAGYAAGMNLAFERARWRGEPREGDVVAILNPDLWFLPRSVETLLAWLAEHPECGAIDPKATIDPARIMHLPRNALPTVGEQVFSVLAQLSPRLCRAFSRRRLRAVLPWWTATEPIRTDMLSGCCIFLRRAVVDELPALMDARYPLYYEDADLCRTLRQRGYELMHHTGAPVLHHWSRSCGVGEEFHGEPMKRYWKSQRAYFRKFYGPAGRGAVAFANWLGRVWPAKWSFRPMHPIVSLGASSTPVEIPLPRSCRYLMELALAPVWVLTVGIFGEGDRWICDPVMWEWMFQADYFMRAIDLETGEVLGAWHYQKSVPGRSEPIRPGELDAAGAPRSASAEAPGGARSEVPA